MLLTPTKVSSCSTSSQRAVAEADVFLLADDDVSAAADDNDSERI